MRKTFDESDYTVEVISPVKFATSIRNRICGKLRDDHSQRSTLCLIPCRDIHTFGMKYAIDVAFLDNKGMVVSSHRQVLPGKRIREKQAVAVVERKSDESDSWFCEGDQVWLSAQPDKSSSKA